MTGGTAPLTTPVVMPELGVDVLPVLSEAWAPAAWRAAALRTDGRGGG